MTDDTETTMPLSDRLSRSLVPPKQWTKRPEALLQNNTVKPLHEVTPRVVLGRQWWDETRRAAYESTDFHCLACGVSKYDALEFKHLEGHETYEIDYRAGRMTYVETVPLCHYCHSFIHDGRLLTMVEKGEADRAKYDAVMSHGRGVLSAAGLTRIPSVAVKGIAKWGDWRMVCFGVEYPPKYKSYEEWCRTFAPYRMTEARTVPAPHKSVKGHRRKK